MIGRQYLARALVVYNEPSLSEDFQIDPSGLVSLPLAGTLKAGLDPERARASIGLEVQQLAKPQGYRLGGRVSAILYYRRGRASRLASLHQRARCLECTGHCRWADLSGQQIDGHDPASGESGLKEYAMDAAVPILAGDIIKMPQRCF
jgi:hypothetical protein